MSARNGNGVKLASGKAKGAEGIAAILRMFLSFEVSNDLPAVLNLVFEPLWSMLLDKDWNADYVLKTDRLFITVKLNIGNCFDILLRANASEHRVRYEMELTRCDVYIRDEPWTYRASGDPMQDAKVIRNVIDTMIRMVGEPILAHEPVENPFLERRCGI